jgi:hypothetical protein
MWRFLGRMARAIFATSDEGLAFRLPKTAEDLLREKISRWHRHALAYDLLEMPRMARRCRAIAGSLRRKVVKRTSTEAA